MEPDSLRGSRTGVDSPLLALVSQHKSFKKLCGKIDFTSLMWECLAQPAAALRGSGWCCTCIAFLQNKLSLHEDKGGNILMSPYATLRQSWRLMHRLPLFLSHRVELSVRLVNKCAFFPPSSYIFKKKNSPEEHENRFDFTPSLLCNLGIIQWWTVWWERLYRFTFLLIFESWCFETRGKTGVWNIS